MATLREIRKRIRSVKSIAKVTKAMQTVSASKMRRSQIMASATRPYADKSWEVLTHLVSRLTPGQIAAQPLLRSHAVHAVDLILISASRGLCGGYNHNVVEAAVSFIHQQTVPVRVVAVGRKGRDAMLRYGYELAGDFEIPDRPGITEIHPIARLVMDDVERGTVGQVWVAYTEFVSTLVQRPKVRLLLPMESVTRGEQCPCLFEPDPQSILDSMLRRFIELQIYQTILESLASEHSARMVAMRNATDNALRLIDGLTLGYNKARQEAITKEILDIVGGAAALEQARAAARTVSP